MNERTNQSTSQRKTNEAPVGQGGWRLLSSAQPQTAKWAGDAPGVLAASLLGKPRCPEKGDRTRPRPWATVSASLSGGGITKPGPRGGPEDDLRKLRQSARCADGPTALARGPAPRLGGSAARSTFCSTRVSQEGRPTHLLRTPQTPRHAVLSPSLRSKGLGFRLLGANFLPLGGLNLKQLSASTDLFWPIPGTLELEESTGSPLLNKKPRSTYCVSTQQLGTKAYCVFI
uniref:Uncharacterized protein n=1 Tax=Myotis myotis TaxID=51298 RepID=A0A7J7XHS6_MYOMY|nr:hypothetical protein mMyoMyo1_011764 [Myotis myotis]